MTLKKRRARNHDRLHRIESEPHLSGALGPPSTPTLPPIALGSADAPQLSSSRNDPNVDILHSVWDEPVIQQGRIEPAGQQDSSGVRRFDYQTWLAEKITSRSLGQTWAFTILFALAAGPWAILGAMLEQFTLGGHRLLLLLLVAPLTEEVMKAAIAMWVVEVKPYLFRNPAQIMLCMITSGLVFATIENLLYLNIYIAEPTASLVAWRWSVCLFLHAGCAAISGMGLIYAWRDGMRRGQRPALSMAMPFLTSAIVTHALYNGFAVISSIF